ncbi:hypothetical protein SKAU_G00045140 [Synaphobranchus kaupii]|uniref:Uncharacterized protein n=1 Tax=Synaphobranchus kaupii TaxID=118154 RepID=A0A9Q1J711_SYNKA|nr:hypothetical protein SKAU_G00045140 [Synaphobranchus kaupii]
MPVIPQCSHSATKDPVVSQTAGLCSRGVPLSPPHSTAVAPPTVSSTRRPHDCQTVATRHPATSGPGLLLQPLWPCPSSVSLKLCAPRPQSCPVTRRCPIA